MSDTSLHIGLLTVELFIPAAQSLKDKRHVIKSIKDRTKNQYNVSVAEVGELDKWQRASLAYVMAGNDNRYIDGALQSIVSFIESFPEAQLSDYRIEFI